MSHFRQPDGDIDWTRAGGEVLRAARGPRSQEALGRRIARTPSVLSRWESGTRSPTAAEALALMEACGLDVASASRTCGVPLPPGPWADEQLSEWLHDMLLGTSVSALSSRMGVSRSTLWRWLSGRTRLRLGEFLGLLDQLAGTALDLVDALVGVDRVPSLTERYRAVSEGRRVLGREPAASLVRWTLDSRGYQRLPVHLPGWIAARIGIDPATEDRCLEALAASGVVDWDGERYRNRISRHLTVSAADDIDEHFGLDRLAHAAESARSPIVDDRIFSNVFLCSDAEFEQVAEAMREAFLGIRQDSQRFSGRGRPTTIAMALVGYPDPPSR